eukprot:421873_1
MGNQAANNANAKYQETINQLVSFGYPRDEIMQAMQSVKNNKDINQIVDWLEEKANNATQFVVNDQYSQEDNTTHNIINDKININIENEEYDKEEKSSTVIPTDNNTKTENNYEEQNDEQNENKYPSIDQAISRHQYEETYGDVDIRQWVAVDFGSFGFSASFCPPHSPSKQRIVQNWCDNRAASELNKDLAALLIDKKTKETIASGYEAKELYAKSQEKKEADQYMYFEHFKPKLYNKDKLQKNALVTASDGKSTLPLFELITKSLIYIMSHTRNYINDFNKLAGFELITNEQILWLVSVPSMYDENSTEAMNYCAQKAGMKYFELISETVASVSFALKTSGTSLAALKVIYGPQYDQSKISERFDLYEDHKVMILDCGGCTVDVSFVDLPSGFAISELNYSDNIMTGSMNVNRTYENLLAKLLPNDIIDEVKTKQQAQWIRLMQEFEIAKYSCPFHLETLFWNVAFSYGINTRLAKVRKKKKDIYRNLQKHIKNYKIHDYINELGKYEEKSMISGSFTLGRSNLKVRQNGWLYFHEPVLNKIVVFLKKIFRNVDVAYTNKIMVVGGYANSEYLISRLRQEFPNKAFIYPRQPQLSVVKGSLYWFANKSIHQQHGTVNTDICTPSAIIDDTKDETYDDTCKPLHQFTVDDICSHIKNWIENDIDYIKHLETMKMIFKKLSLNGKQVSMLPTDNVRRMVEKELEFMTAETVEIVFHCFSEFKNNKNNNLQNKSEEEIAEIIYCYPLEKLLIEIKKEKMDGSKFIGNYLNNCEFIKNITGWKQADINQISNTLFKHYVFDKEEFAENMNNILNDKYSRVLSSEVVNEIKNVIREFVIDKIQYKIKTGQRDDVFGDMIINLVEDLLQQNEINKKYEKHKAYFGEDFVKCIYDAIAECFTIKSQFPAANEWICINCGNANFNKYINSKLCTNLSTCSLCGITQVDCVSLNIKHFDTYLMVNEIDENDQTEDDTKDDIDKLIDGLLKNDPFELFCLHRNDKEMCPSIRRLAKQLIRYKRWLFTIYKKTKGNDDIERTVEIDIAKHVNDQIYKTIFIQTAKHFQKISKTDLQSLTKTFEDNAENIQNVKTILEMKRLNFAKVFLKKYTKIKVSTGAKLYTAIMKSLKQKAQTLQYGAFLSDLDIDTIDKDYHHILNSHINAGNKTTIKNALRFFKEVVHYEDLQSEIEQCRSAKRNQSRILRLNSESDHKQHNIDLQNSEINSSNKNIWQLKQYYIQSQLDIMHSYLVHSNWEYFVKRYMDKCEHKNNEAKTNDDSDDDDIIQNEWNASDLSPIDDINNQNKYVTESDESDVTNYGFGIEHSHQHMLPKYGSVYDELLLNAFCKLSDKSFNRLITKSIKKHQIAVGTEYKNHLRCKYYNKEYNIIRNELIGIRHIFAIIVYTDMSDYCTE